MSGNRRFVDTNILVYAYDVAAADKHDIARAIVTDLWESGAGCVSVQVLQEFFVTVTRKVANPLDVDTAAMVVSDLSRWHVYSPCAADVLDAIDLCRRQSLSYWDAMIIRSADKLRCDVLYSEDLNAGQRYEGVRVSNPFLND